jgi:pimeloyl-ACP methyl ester carboxylesterase
MILLTFALMNNKFEYIDRGHGRAMVFLPGWGTDCRIFDGIEAPYDYIRVRGFDPFSFEEVLVKFLDERGLSTAAFCGFSLGAFAAVHFARCFPLRVSRLFLIGLRERYPKRQLDFVRGRLSEDAAGYMGSFFACCFRRKEAVDTFHARLFPGYHARIKVNHLLRTLDYLGTVDVRPEYFTKDVPVTFIHGDCDEIAPYEEVRRIKNGMAHGELVTLENTGHLCFLEKSIDSILRK